MRGLNFSYGRFEPMIFRNLNLDISKGECVALVGPSGSGKSTLVALLTGGLRATNGLIEYDGIPLTDSTESRILPSIGSVMQSDCLITGTIAENISFFRNLSEEDIREAATTARIDEFIMNLPMRYGTLVSDLFPSISGGQRQRILIARAVAGRPKFLIMDEATSFLDRESESSVSQAIAKLCMTRLIIAHRQETIAQCERTINIESVQSPSMGESTSEKQPA